MRTFHVQLNRRGFLIFIIIIFNYDLDLCSHVDSNFIWVFSFFLTPWSNKMFEIFLLQSWVPSLDGNIGLSSTLGNENTENYYLNEICSYPYSLCKYVGKTPGLRALGISEEVLFKTSQVTFLSKLRLLLNNDCHNNLNGLGSILLVIIFCVQQHKRNLCKLFEMKGTEEVWKFTFLYIILSSLATI